VVSQAKSLVLEALREIRSKELGLDAILRPVLDVTRR
jgi:hypothetical protein